MNLAALHYHLTVFGVTHVGLSSGFKHTIYQSEDKKRRFSFLMSEEDLDPMYIAIGCSYLKAGIPESIREELGLF